MRCRPVLILPLLWCSGSLLAGDLAAPTLAKFLRVLVQATGVKGVACSDKELAGELANLGVALEPDSKLVWVDSDKDLQRLAHQGKAVVCGTRGLLAAGACVAVVAEGGRPVIYVNPKGIAAAGITLPDSVMKIAKVAQ